jgi:hypothetical protein
MIFDETVVDRTILLLTLLLKSVAPHSPAFSRTRSSAAVEKVRFNRGQSSISEI